MSAGVVGQVRPARLSQMLAGQRKVPSLGTRSGEDRGVSTASNPAESVEVGVTEARPRKRESFPDAWF